MFKIKTLTKDTVIPQIALYFSVCLLLASLPAAVYHDGLNEMIKGLRHIVLSPCPLVTDYFALGRLSSAFLNAGVCGMSWFLMMWILKGNCETSTLAGYFLVVAHCFYGLNFLNMWPPVIGMLFFCRKSGIRFRDNLGMAMFSTAFGPFFSELLFRYTLGQSYRFGHFNISLYGIFLAILMALILGLAIPAMLPGVVKMHKGYNLYNGGLAFGLLGLFLYSMMYKTMGVEPPVPLKASNLDYNLSGHSYGLYVNVFFLIVFAGILAAGWLLNGRSFKGYGRLMKDSGHGADFFDQYSAALVLVNIGIYGLMMLAYFDLVIGLTDGAGFTGPTTGIILAAITFSSSGQHPKNVWPVLSGFVVLYGIVAAISVFYGREIPWTLSTQGYMNAAAFATGLCPLAGRYGNRIGILSGMLCACICTSTSAIHGGFVLYNGGLTAGITALIMVPCVEYYQLLVKK